jgi:hypothetical protein
MLPRPILLRQRCRHAIRLIHKRDGALNLPPEKYSLEVRRRVAIQAAKSSFDEGVKTLEVHPRPFREMWGQSRFFDAPSCFFSPRELARQTFSGFLLRP